MLIQDNCSLQSLNSFGIEAIGAKLITIETNNDYAYLNLESANPYILGGGSNVLLTHHIDEPIVNINTKGKQIIIDNEDHVLVQFAAGEIWHDAVIWAIENDLGGIENLSLIPGKCGAAPMQNIGAYGVEIKDILSTVKVYELKSGRHLKLHASECGFGYRTSYFKTKWKGQFIITDIILKLTKNGNHEINTSYGAISNVLDQKGISHPTIKDVSDTVIEIRQRKLPDPGEIGNAGSFFKNPVVSQEVFASIQNQYPEMPFYPDQNGIKIPAGWLIDQCGFKGMKYGKTGSYKSQALVIVNRGGASGQEILDYSRHVQTTVLQKFGIQLETEVNIW